MTQNYYLWRDRYRVRLLLWLPDSAVKRGSPRSNGEQGDDASMLQLEGNSLVPSGQQISS